MLDGQIIMLKKWLLLCLEGTCSACRIINSRDQNKSAIFLLFYLAHEVSSKDRASLSVLLALVSVGIVSSSAPLALEVEGL